MKAELSAICMAFIVVSCAGDTTPAQGVTAAQAKVAEAKKPKAAPKPKPYPLKTCLVSGEGLDEMDERVSTVYEGQTFEFCCKPCLVKFKKDPEKYAGKLAETKTR
ncbi:YHS domain-containing protein [Akkermansiaceae bacterium]|nr:YHS domain-containing protein [Akkermansiaceae bacterium]